jgi:Tol biopolymer transport system component
MASIVSGYEYDIFISYRHNDNLDGWVTDFVQNLEKELRGTLKDSLAIYFDKNPHDGLLETHNVDDSLKEKLKCLIFIPVISQTYCDPKSFAWSNEFLVFLQMAAADGHGLKVRLQNGNTASRVLPIRIHELDAHDKKIIEAELGPLRAIDFTYQSAGVNRPLRPKDDETIKTNAQNVYRDQVNKAANAIKEIIHGLQHKPTPENEKNSKSEISSSFPERAKTGEVKQKLKIKLPTFSTLSLLAFGFLFSSISLIAVLVFHFSQPVQQTPTYKAIIPIPDKTRLISSWRNNMALSPDGSMLAFVAADSVGKSLLWVRHLNATNAQVLTGTEGATLPFWSPDSRFIGFFTDGRLRKIKAAGGVPQTICDISNGRGGTWNKEGAIIFSGNTSTSLSMVSSSGGRVTNVTKLDSTRKENGHRWPCFLPDGKHFLFLSRLNLNSATEGDGIFLASTDTTIAPRLLIKASSNMAFANDHLLFANRNTLMAQPFDAGNLKTTGEAFPLFLEHINFDYSKSDAAFTASQNGTLLYQQFESLSSGLNLVWHDRTGKQTGMVDLVAEPYGMRLSPDEKRIAAAYPDNKGTVDAWLYDVNRALWTRFTFDEAIVRNPIWSPDSRTIVFSSNRNEKFDLYMRAANGEGEEELLFKSNEDKFPFDWSPDGKFLVYNTGGGGDDYDIWILPMSREAGGERKPFVFLKTEFEERRAAFSPDGRWIAYQSKESGRDEVYIRPFPGPGGKWQVSTGGGTRPRWRGDGKELFYLSEDLKITAAEVRADAKSVEITSVKPLFPIEYLSVSSVNVYSVTADGQRFLVETPSNEANSTPFTLVVNWPGEIKKK